MNGIHLLRTLTELGCPVQDDTSPESVDWMFTDDAAVPFLEWFCTNIDPSHNHLSTEELEKFAVIKDQGLVLEGEELANAHKHLVSHDSDVTDAELEQEIMALKSEYETREQRISKLIEMTNRLNMRQTSLTHKASMTGKAAEKAEDAYQKRLKNASNDDEVVNNELKKLVCLSEQLIGMYETEAETEKNKSGLFLSQQSMDLHSFAHEQLIQAMKAFTQKQFFDGISQIPNASGKEVSDISSLERKEKVKSDNAAELARLWKVYEQCEWERVQTALREGMLSAELSFAQDKLKSYQMPGHCSDMQTLHKDLKDAQRLIARSTADVTNLLENRIHDLIRHCANGQSVHILEAEYDLKIARQDYFINSQEKVINQLIRQQALYEFLSLCSAEEIHDHQKNKQLLSAVTMDLKQCVHEYEKRLEMMAKLEPREKDLKTVVDASDHMVQSMHRIIDPSGHQNSLYVTYKSMVESATALADDVSSLENSEVYLRREGNERLTKLEKTLKGYESRLYSESSTMRGVPQLSPQQLVDVMKNLESGVERLESALLDVTKQISEKRALLAKNSLLQEERKLFIRFHTDPERLKTKLVELSNRIEARSIGK